MAAANTPFTSGGSTVAFGTTAITIPATSIGGSSNTLPTVDQTDLSHTVMSKVPGTVMEHEDVTVEGFLKGSDYKTLRAAIDASAKVIETITVTDPLLTSESTASKEVATTGFITSVVGGARTNNEMVTVTVTFSWGAGSTLTNAT